MKTVLFLMVPHLSHYYPTFGLARLLQRQGYTIVYSGTSSYQAAVEQEGFLFRSVLYVEEIVIRKLRVAIGLWIKTRLERTYTSTRYRCFLAGMQTVEQLMADTKPDVVFLDDTLGHYYPCLAGKAKVIQLSTKLSPRRHPFIPPLNSFYVPQRALMDSLITKAQWWGHIRRRRLNGWLQSLVFNGRSDAEFQRRYERQKGVVWTVVRDENMAFYDAVAGLPALVLAPKSLEFENTPTAPKEHYLYTPHLRNEQPYVSAEYVQWMERVIYRKQVNKTRLVYVALGTLSLGQAERAYKLLTNITHALGGDDTIDVLMATGGLDLSCSTVAANVYCLPAIPQLDVLKHADLMITHGGLGSVKECLAAGVPMLVYPLNTQVDQPGNSARVVHKGLGLRGKINESSTRIRRKVYTLLENPVYRKNCQVTQQHFMEDGQTAQQVLTQLGLWTRDLSSSDHINQSFTIKQLQL